MKKSRGLVLRSLSGFYTVQTKDGTVVCRARGVLRREAGAPMVGDHVEVWQEEGEDAVLAEVLPRKNAFARPPLANLSRICFVVSTCDPAPNLLVLDKLIAVAEYQDIQPVVVITKCDLAPADRLREIYTKAGIPVYAADYAHGENGPLLELLSDGISAFCGNSGVGKSTLLNRLLPGLGQQTGETSRKLGRGKHTTRAVELFSVGGGYVADTPGFSTVVVARYGRIPKEQLQYCFREFARVPGSCRFSGCSHTSEPGCAVLQALQRGEISPSRHQSYLVLYEEAKQYKEWE